MKIKVSQLRSMVEEAILIEKKKSKSKKKASTKRKSKKKARRKKRKAKRDACYHKVKSRYDVWPSAYASGALVKCRKVGAKNWGNKSKKESMESNYLRQMVEQEISNLNEKKKKKKKNTLGDWFAQQGAPGPEGGWVDCNTCRKDKKTGRKKCKKCGRDTGEKRAKYPKCRPTPSACSKPGNYGKKSKAGKKG